MMYFPGMREVGYMDIKIGKKNYFGAGFLTERIVTSESLIKILESDTSEIESIEFVPPRIDSDDFGRFKVKWKFPPFNPT